MPKVVALFMLAYVHIQASVCRLSKALPSSPAWLLQLAVKSLLKSAPLAMRAG